MSYWTKFGFTLSLQKQLRGMSGDVYLKSVSIVNKRIYKLIETFEAHYYTFVPVPHPNKRRASLRKENESRKAAGLKSVRSDPRLMRSKNYGDYSTGKYALNLEILLDIDPMTPEQRSALKNGVYNHGGVNGIPVEIRIRNHTVKPGHHGKYINYRYSDRVEVHGWKHTKPYRPIKKALNATKKDMRNITVDTKSYGLKALSFSGLSRKK